jgi:hypothetical protein
MYTAQKSMGRKTTFDGAKGISDNILINTGLSEISGKSK